MTVMIVSTVLQGNGVIVGLGICGVVINATSSAAGLMGDFRTGYICLAAPRAMFGAQLVGQLLGAVLTPLAFMLFYETGQVKLTTCFQMLLRRRMPAYSHNAASVTVRKQALCSTSVSSAVQYEPCPILVLVDLLLMTWLSSDSFCLPR